MKRFLIGLAVLAGVAATLGLVRAEISTDAAALRIAGVLVPVGTRAPLVSADASVRLFPRLAVVFQKVRVAASDSATLESPDLTADRIVADVDLLPLFVGQTSISRFVVDRPQLRITTTLDLQGLTPDRGLLDRMLPASVVVHNGAVRLETPDRMHAAVISGIEARMQWPRALGNLSIDGSAMWRGERIGLSLQGIAPQRLAAGQPGDVDVTLDAPSLRLSYAGKALLSDRLQLDGLFSASFADPNRMANAGGDVGSLVAMPPVDVTGRLHSQGWMASLSEAHLRMGPAAADGVLSLRLDAARPQLRGTLAIGDVDLTPAFAAAGDRAWLDWAPDPSVVAGLDVDFRLSIADALIGATHVSDLAASLLVADGQLHGEIGDADLFGGTGSMSVRGTMDANGLTATGRVSLTDASVSLVRRQLALQGLPALTGSLSWNGEFETSGKTLGMALDRLEARATCAAPLLALDEPAAAVVLLASAKSSLLRAASVRLGAYPKIERLICVTAFAGKALRIPHLTFALAGLNIDLAGSARLNDRALGLTGAARPDPSIVLATGAATPALMAPLVVAGTIDRPVASFSEDIPAANAPADVLTGTIPRPALPN